MFIVAAIVLGVVSWVVLAMLYRTVVATNVVDIVQSRTSTTSYGTGQEAGNVYYAWPAWVPRFGITVISLPVSNFDIPLKDYEAYDKDRVPFEVDVAAFFRIYDTAEAAQRIASILELKTQLLLIVQGAVRKVLAFDVIDAIMVERAKFGAQFTEEVKEQLKEWGVEPVKSMELMDIRDSQRGGEHKSRVIANIMAKKTSHIEMESRREVAANMRAAETAEIEAKQAIDISAQVALQAVGQRTAEKEKAVGIADQQAEQEVLTQRRETRERDMAVKRVEQVRQAEITKDQQVVAAQQDQETRVIIAEGQLEAKRREATGIQVEGTARAEAEKLMQLAPVQAQITLAQEIGQNQGYQSYLAIIESVKAHIIVGSEQAKALQDAQIKVLVNTGNPTEGVQNVMGLFSSKGGAELAGMVEAFALTPLGKKALATIGINEETPLNGVKVD